MYLLHLNASTGTFHNKHMSKILSLIFVIYRQRYYQPLEIMRVRVCQRYDNIYLPFITLKLSVHGSLDRVIEEQNQPTLINMTEYITMYEKEVKAACCEGLTKC